MPLPLERSLSDVLPVAPATSSALASPAFALEFHSPAREGRITKADRIQQALLATALNFFSHLPVELMLMIFTEVISEETSSCDYTFLYAGLYTHRRLAAVCKWWHAVIKGIPPRTGRRLYCNVNLSISTSMTPMSAGDMASMLRDYLANSGNENLNVLIDLRCATGSLRPCALALIAQSHRWRSARIVGDLHDEDARSALAMLTGRLPVLQTLEFGHIPATEINETTEEVDFGFLAHAPALTELFLLGPFSASLINITIPSNNIIRSFGCDGIEAYVLLDYLDEMPGLQELDFAYDDYEEDGDESADPEPVTTSLGLPYLTKLILRNTAYAVKSFFIAAVSLPAIEKVIFSKDGFHVAAALTALKDRKRQRGDADGVITRFLH
ncbi:uncharacterized protein SCHCODRAFT_02540672 [Schizophyllum commune H4-8]|nr:uncharacterized protein SCHCODRAFT_02540672 [Schizophyllum commune H4-8]KAI5894286.1 hypothetical protein SCHCODRAFT_02540672 [Schizophyllum commune H4-8]